VGSKVSLTAVDGKPYNGTITDIQDEKYKVKYDGFDFEAWLTNNQFTVVNTTTPPTYTPATQTNNLAGSKVSFLAVDGKTYTGIIKDFQGNNYRVKYDGFDFESWLTREQFTLAGAAGTYIPVTKQPNYTLRNTGETGTQDLKNIFDFGKQQGWASQVHENKFNSYINQLSGEDKNKLAAFLNQATTSSARFFALKSLLSGDSYTVIQKFIKQLNQFPESYQQEKCLITNRRSIIQQWEFSCSVTTVQTYLADLCPRYAWEVKQVSNYDVAADDPYNNPMGQQQKMLMEKYGGVATPRGDFSGKAIAIDNALNEFVGRILGVKFYFKQVNESLTTVFDKIRNMLDKGLDEPLLIGFVGSQAKHFILVMKYRNTGSGYQYLIYDPWDGVCDYVNESTILQGSLAPLLTQWRISVDYYYPTE
jgi:hypothetical protein